jgi:hypothetical protein
VTVVVVVVTVMVSEFIFVPVVSLLSLVVLLLLTDVVYIGVLLLCFDVDMFLYGCGVEMVAESMTEILVKSGEDFGNNLFLKISNLFLKKDIIFGTDILLSYCMTELLYVGVGRWCR